MTHRDWRPPHCEHGNIILGCPDDNCVAQNAYLEQQNAAMREWDHRGHQAARDLVRSSLGLPLDTYVCPECGPDHLNIKDLYTESVMTLRNRNVVGSQGRNPHVHAKQVQDLVQPSGAGTVV